MEPQYDCDAIEIPFDVEDRIIEDKENSNSNEGNFVDIKLCFFQKCLFLDEKATHWERYVPSMLKTQRSRELKPRNVPIKSKEQEANKWNEVAKAKLRLAEENINCLKEKHQLEINILTKEHEEKTKIIREEHEEKIKIMREEHELKVKVLQSKLELNKKQMYEKYL